MGFVCLFGGGVFWGGDVHFKSVDSVLCDMLFHHFSAKALRDHQTSLLKLLCAQMSVTCEQGGTPERGICCLVLCIVSLSIRIRLIGLKKSQQSKGIRFG